MRRRNQPGAGFFHNRHHPKEFIPVRAAAGAKERFASKLLLQFFNSPSPAPKHCLRRSFCGSPQTIQQPWRKIFRASI